MEAAGGASADREANVGFANALLETEIVQRNARKDAQESAARWTILTAGALMTLLLALARDAGILETQDSAVARTFFVLTLVSAAVSAICAIGTLWPRHYERLGEEGLDRLNKRDFLDQPTHEVTGQVAATRIGIAKKMDELHEAKARWLKIAFAALAATLICIIIQGIALGVDPPSSTTPSTELETQKNK